MRSSAEKKGGLGVSPGYDTTQHAHAHNKPSAIEKGQSFDCNTTHPRHEARTRATSNSNSRLSSTFSALGAPAKPNWDMLRNALMC